MIEVEQYKHDTTRELESHIKFGIESEHKKLISVSTRDTFWSFSIFNKESTITWDV